MQVKKDCIVSIRYTMKNSAGTVLEDTMQANPVSYLQGGEKILLSLQEQMEGLKAGERKKVFLYQLPGSTAEDFVFDITIDAVRTALPEEILLGYPVQAAITPCEAGCDCYRSA